MLLFSTRELLYEAADAGARGVREVFQQSPVTCARGLEGKGEIRRQPVSGCMSSAGDNTKVRQRTGVKHNDKFEGQRANEVHLVSNELKSFKQPSQL